MQSHGKSKCMQPRMGEGRGQGEGWTVLASASASALSLVLVPPPYPATFSLSVYMQSLEPPSLCKTKAALQIEKKRIVARKAVQDAEEVAHACRMQAAACRCAHMGTGNTTTTVECLR